MVTEALPSLGLIALGVAGIALFGRDRDDADQQEVADYRPALAPARRHWPLVASATVGQRRLRAHAYADLVLPPIPVDTTIGLPLYAASVVAEQMREQYGTTSPDVIARLWLRELGAEARAGLAVAG